MFGFYFRFSKFQRVQLDKMILLILIFASSIVFASSGIINDLKEEICNNLTSCSNCVGDTSCAWCVTKNKCMHSCGTNIAIFPESVPALFAGPQFCPRVSQLNEELVLKSGVIENITVKVTQVHMYMSFTPWKCKITNGKELLVNATIAADIVFCEAVVLDKVSKEGHSIPKVQVFWQNINALDGYLPIKVI